MCNSVRDVAAGRSRVCSAFFFGCLPAQMRLAPDTASTRVTSETSNNARGWTKNVVAQLAYWCSLDRVCRRSDRLVCTLTPTTLLHLLTFPSRSNYAGYNPKHKVKFEQAGNGGVLSSAYTNGAAVHRGSRAERPPLLPVWDISSWVTNGYV